MLKNTKVIKPVMMACSAGLLLTACATERETTYSSNTSYDSGASSGSIREGSGSDWQQSSTSRSQSNWNSSNQSSYSSQGQQVSGNEVVIPLHEERLNVGKRTVDAGTVTIRKVVTTETVNQPIELRRETLVIDREGAGAQAQRNTQFQSSTSSQNQTSRSGAGVSAQANAGQSGAGFSAQAGNQSADAQADTDADVDADANIKADESGVGASAQADFDQSEPAGANTSAQAQNQNQSSSNYQSSSSSSSSQSYSSSPASGNAFREETYTIQLKEEQPVIEKNVVQTGQVTARKNAEMQRQTVQREIRREDVRVDQGANARNVQLRGNFDSASNINDPSGAQGSARIQSDSDVDASSSHRTETSVETESTGTYRDAESDSFEDKNTLDDINRGSNTRGGAEDLQRFDERSNPRD